MSFFPFANKKNKNKHYWWFFICLLSSLTKPKWLCVHKRWNNFISLIFSSAFSQLFSLIIRVHFLFFPLSSRFLPSSDPNSWNVYATVCISLRGFNLPLLTLSVEWLIFFYFSILCRITSSKRRFSFFTQAIIDTIAQTSLVRLQVILFSDIF